MTLKELSAEKKLNGLTKVLVEVIDNSNSQGDKRFLERAMRIIKKWKQKRKE